MARAEECAAEGKTALIVQHTSRLARGDAEEAQHLIEVALWAKKAGVRIASVQNPIPEGPMGLLVASVYGNQDHEESKRKGLATAAGMLREVERGQWRGGTIHGGYEARYEHEGGKVVRRWLVKAPEEVPAYQLMWDLAAEGKSDGAIQLELSKRGYRTVPRRKDRKAQPFSIRSIGLTLRNPFYAGLQTFGGKTYPGEWPTYVDLDVFEHIQARRRSHTTTSKGGNPPVGAYLLRGLVYCRCGAPAHAMTGRVRKDGTRKRTYVCSAHRSHHRNSEEWCPRTPWDAVEVDRRTFASIEQLLGDAEALNEQMEAGRRAERDKLEQTAKRAQEEVAKAEKAAERAMAEFADAEDAEERVMLKDAATLKRKAATDARTLADAALDAEPEGDPQEAMARLWHTLGSELSDADGDVELMREALRARFRFTLEHGPHGPLVRAHARDLWSKAVEAANKPPYKLYAHVPAVCGVPLEGFVELPAFAVSA